MIVLDIAALLFGIAGLVVALVTARLARDANRGAGQAHRESIDALTRSAIATDLNGRAHTQAGEAMNRAAAASAAAERAQALAAEALSRANAAASLAHGLDEINRASGHPTAHAGVRWEAEQIRPGRWLIRNAGTSVAVGALVSDATRPPKFITAEEVIPRDVDPGDNLQFRVASARDAPPPRVRVTWSESGLSERRAFELTLVI